MEGDVQQELLQTPHVAFYGGFFSLLAIQAALWDHLGILQPLKLLGTNNPLIIYFPVFND